MNKPGNDKITKEQMALQAWLTEYEITSQSALANWRQRYILVGLNIAAIGTLTSLAITNNTELFLYVISLLSSVLGIVWVAEMRWTIRTIDELNNRLIPALRKLADDENILKAEEKLRHTLEGKRELICHILTGGSPSGTTGIFVFFLPSFISVIIACFNPFPNSDTITYSSYALPFALLDFFLIIILSIGGYQLVKDWRSWIKKSQKS